MGGCGDNLEAGSAVNPIASMGVGGHADLAASVTGHVAAGVEAATWTLDDPSTAIVTALPESGPATATGTVDGFTAQFAIDVDSHVDLLALEVTPPTLALPLGLGAQVTSLATIFDGTHLDITALTQWSVTTRRW